MMSIKPSKEIDDIMNMSKKFADKHNHRYILTEHILHSILQFKDFTNVLKDYGVDVKHLQKDVNNYLTGPKMELIKNIRHRTPEKTRRIDEMFQKSVQNVIREGRETLTIYDIFIALMDETDTYSSYFLKKYGIEKDEYRKFLKENHIEKIMDLQQKEYFKAILEEFCTNLNELARENKIDPVIGRNNEVDSICQVFARRNKPNVLMVGDPGVGKTAIAEGLAKRIVDDEVPKYIKDHTVYNLEVGTLLAGTSFRGQFEDRIKDIIKALLYEEKCILFIDEAHTMRGAGGGGNNGGADMANMLKPVLSKGKLKVIANTTWEEYTESFEKDRALMRRFQRIEIDEPTPKTAKKILKSAAKYYEEFHGVKINPKAIKEAVNLSVRYQPDRRLPDKAFDLIDIACARQRKLEKPNPEITVDLVRYEMSEISGIPLDQITDADHHKDVSKMESAIKANVYGQDEAIDAVMESIYISQAGLHNENKPIGSYVFMGPTGTGKTELAKQLAEQLGYNFLRYDMSEYQEKNTIARFIGTSPGYVGYDDSNISGGLLIKDIERNPHSVILFDEIEKAHKDVSNVLLQLLDEGIVTSSNGKKANAKNCIIILTTNLGSATKDAFTIGFGGGDKIDNLFDEYNEFFRPEFRNRITAVCRFNELDMISRRKVVAKFINQVRNRLKHQNVEIHVHESAVDKIINMGYDEKMGARPIERVINKHIVLPISKKLLINDGKCDMIEVDVKDDEFVFEKTQQIETETVNN